VVHDSKLRGRDGRVRLFPFFPLVIPLELPVGPVRSGPSRIRPVRDDPPPEVVQERACGRQAARGREEQQRELGRHRRRHGAPRRGGESPEGRAQQERRGDGPEGRKDHHGQDGRRHVEEREIFGIDDIGRCCGLDVDRLLVCDPRSSWPCCAASTRRSTRAVDPRPARIIVVVVPAEVGHKISVKRLPAFKIGNEYTT